MKHLIFPLLLLIGFNVNLFAQKIVSVKENGTEPYAYVGERLNDRELGKILKSNPAAYRMYEDSKGATNISLLLGGIGGYLIGDQIGKLIYVKNGSGRNIFMWSGGLALSVTALATGGIAKKRRSEAVERYNRDFPAVPANNTITLKLGTTPDGVGLVIKF